SARRVLPPDGIRRLCADGAAGIGTRKGLMLAFLKRLEAHAEASGSLLCVGLDPHPGLFPEHTPGAVRDFCLRLIDATADLACAFKPNSALFAALGGEGYVVLREVIAHVPADIPVSLDAKRGDIA